MPGASATYDFDVAPISGFDGTIHFDVSGLPPDATANFSANDITPPAETTLTVSTSATTPLGQYLLTITADGDATQHSVTVGLYVTQAAPGGGAIDYPAFYSYAYPAPAGFAEARVGPDGAFYSKDYGEFILPYERVARAASPDDTLLAFLQSTYEAAATLATWDRAALESSFLPGKR